MSFFNFDKKDKSDDRSHQDNCKGKHLGPNGWDNGSYQYCKTCGAHRRFEWGRCISCKNN